MRIKLVAIVLLILAIFLTCGYAENSVTPRMTEKDLITLFENSEYGSLMDYWYDVETQYGVFFRWEYYEKPIGASALASIIENNPDVDSDWPELQAIIDTGFTLPSGGCVSSEEAYLYACKAINEAFDLPENWQKENAVCFSFINNDTEIWRVIFWAQEGNTHVPTFTGLVLIDAHSGKVISIRQNDPSSFSTSIPITDRL